MRFEQQVRRLRLHWTLQGEAYFVETPRGVCLVWKRQDLIVPLTGVKDKFGIYFPTTDQLEDRALFMEPIIQSWETRLATKDDLARYSFTRGRYNGLILHREKEVALYWFEKAPISSRGLTIYEAWQLLEQYRAHWFWKILVFQNLIYYYEGPEAQKMLKLRYGPAGKARDPKVEITSSSV